METSSHPAESREASHEHVRAVSACRICGSDRLKQFLSLGNQPHCNSFLTLEQLDEPEPHWPLSLLFCEDCHLVQLTHAVDPEVMFRNYVYVSGTTDSLRAHFGQSAENIIRRFNLAPKSLIVDIGSNDGTFLKQFQARGMEPLGVDPATNIAVQANAEGVPTINDFFGERVASAIREEHGPASVITAAGVFFHIDDMDDVCRGIAALLADDGVLRIEAIYLRDMLEQCSYDNIYHEHVSYYTLAPLQHLLSRFDIEIFHVERAPIHGGILVVDAGHKGRHIVDESVSNLLDEEVDQGLDTLAPYVAFAKAVEANREDLRNLVFSLRKQGATILAYGAPAKGNTLLNYCGFDAHDIVCAVEKAPLKVGLYTPGTHIPVRAETDLDQLPDYFLLLPWNFKDELLAKNKAYREQGGKFIIPIPRPEIV